MSILILIALVFGPALLLWVHELAEPKHTYLSTRAAIGVALWAEAQAARRRLERADQEFGRVPWHTFAAVSVAVRPSRPGDKGGVRVDKPRLAEVVGIGVHRG
jgi:hypothetical protein